MRHGTLLHRFCRIYAALFTISILCFPLRAAHVLFSYGDFAQTVQTNRRVYLYPLTTASFTATNLVTTDRIGKTTDTSGQAWVSNMIAGTYRGEFLGTYRVTTNWFTIPDTNAVLYASNCISSSTVSSGEAITGYTEAQANLRFQKGSLNLTNWSTLSTNVIGLPVSATNLSPWNSDINGAGFALTNAGGITATGTVVGNKVFDTHGLTVARIFDASYHYQITTNANAAYLWVATNGNDATAVRGDKSKPWRHIFDILDSLSTNGTPGASTGAVLAAQSGDTIVVEAGVHTNPVIPLPHNVNLITTNGATIVQADTGNNVIPLTTSLEYIGPFLQPGNNSVIDGFTIDADNLGAFQAAVGTWDQINTDDTGNGYSCQFTNRSATNALVRNCSIYGGSDGLYINCTNPSPYSIGFDTCAVYAQWDGTMFYGTNIRVYLTNCTIFATNTQSPVGASHAIVAGNGAVLEDWGSVFGACSGLNNASAANVYGTARMVCDGSLFWTTPGDGLGLFETKIPEGNFRNTNLLTSSSGTLTNFDQRAWTNAYGQVTITNYSREPASYDSFGAINIGEYYLREPYDEVLYIGSLANTNRLAITKELGVFVTGNLGVSDTLTVESNIYVGNVIVTNYIQVGSGTMYISNTAAGDPVIVSAGKELLGVGATEIGVVNLGYYNIDPSYRQFPQTVNIGINAYTMDNGVSIGWSTSAGSNSVGIGPQANAGGIGGGDYNIAVGQSAGASGSHGIAIGRQASGGNNGVGIGTLAAAWKGSVAIGDHASANDAFGDAASIAIGPGATADYAHSIAIGGTNLTSDPPNLPAQANAIGAVEIGGGRASTAWGLHYRGNLIVNSNGVHMGDGSLLTNIALGSLPSAVLTNFDTRIWTNTGGLQVGTNLAVRQPNQTNASFIVRTGAGGGNTLVVTNNLVGIRRGDPAYELDVVGSGYFSGLVYANGLTSFDDIYGQGSLDLTNGANRLWFNRTNGDLTVSGTVSAGSINWTDGNVTYVPIGADIQTYITAATAGDTLVLGSGTYTLADTVTVNKQLNIVGQGHSGFVTTLLTPSHGTVIASTIGGPVFLLLTNNIRLVNVSINVSGVGATGIDTTNNLSGLILADIDVISRGSGECHSIYIRGSDATLRNMTFYCESTDNTAYGLWCENYNGCRSNNVIEAFGVTGITKGSATEAYGWLSYNVNCTNTITLNIYDSVCQTLAGTAKDVGIASESVTTANAVVNAYFTTVTGADWDAFVEGANQLNLGGSVVSGNKIGGTGTATYRTTMVSGSVTATNLAISVTNLIAPGGSKINGIGFTNGNLTVSGTMYGNGVGLTNVAEAVHATNSDRATYVAFPGGDAVTVLSGAAGGVLSHYEGQSYFQFDEEVRAASFNGDGQFLTNLPITAINSPQILTNGHSVAVIVSNDVTLAGVASDLSVGGNAYLTNNLTVATNLTVSGNVTNAAIKLEAGTANTLVITNGRVGIGTASPLSALDLSSGTAYFDSGNNSFGANGLLITGGGDYIAAGGINQSIRGYGAGGKLEWTNATGRFFYDGTNGNLLVSGTLTATNGVTSYGDVTLSGVDADLSVGGNANVAGNATVTNNLVVIGTNSAAKLLINGASAGTSDSVNISGSLRTSTSIAVGSSLSTSSTSDASPSGGSIFSSGGISATKQIYSGSNGVFAGTLTATNGVRSVGAIAWDAHGRGMLVFSNATESFATDTTPVVVTNWTSSAGLRNVGASTAGGTLTLTNAGNYDIDCQVSFETSTQPADCFGEIYLDAVATGFRFKRDMSANNAAGSASIFGNVTATAGQAVSLRISSSAAETMIIKCAQLRVTRNPD